MRFESYTRIYSIVLACGITALVIMLLLGVADSSGFKEEKKMLAVSGLSAIACALAVNVTCGIQHRKMLGRSSHIITREQSGRWFFVVDVPAQIALSVFMLFLAYRVWTGVIAISL